ncbi:MAG: prepilin-type N-terminal cleavage/methylation domain-containing protein [Deltaproteobacteria bacterium]|nr:prepilin-type N-terminal cleavage/methylation domain-containing protein [Deltaproteobacteria bacterium]
MKTQKDNRCSLFRFPGDLLKPLQSPGQNRGFSLVELMIVVAIIGVLSALAVPRFRTFQAKARQAEAKSNLAFIYTLQQSYFGDNDKFATMEDTGNGTDCPENELGFVLKPCDSARYVYKSSSTDAAVDFAAVATSGTGSSNKVLTGCSSADEWRIDQEKCLCALNDVTKHCDDTFDECASKC